MDALITGIESGLTWLALIIGAAAGIWVLAMFWGEFVIHRSQH